MKVIYTSGPVSLQEHDTPRGKRVLLDMGQEAVMIVPQAANGKFVLTAQTRVGQSEPTYEFPSGGIEGNESPEAAARRELREEVGASTEDWEFVCVQEPLTGLVNFKVHIFVARIDGACEQSKDLEDGEDVTTVEFSLEELQDYAKKAKVVDGYLLAGLAALHLSSLYEQS